MKKLSLSFYLVVCLSTLWAVLAILSLLQVFNHDALSKFIATLELIVQVFTMGLTIKIYYNSSGRNRGIFLWLLLANIASFLNDLFFYIPIYMRHIPLTDIPFPWFISYFAPFLIWLAALTILLARILVPFIFTLKSFIKMFGLFFVLNLAVITLFFISIIHRHVDLNSVVLSLDFSCTYRLILFDLALFCLICSKDLGMQAFLSGIIVLAAAAFLVDYTTIGDMSGALIYGELFWFSGILLMFFGVFFINKNKSYDVKNCFRKMNTIKSRLVFVIFGVSVGSFLVFFIIAYAFSLIDKIVFVGLPLFIMIYSVIAVLASLFMGKNFEAPFIKITHNIELLKQDNEQVIDDHFSLEEFVFLQQFISDAFKFKEEKDQATKILGEITAKVVHDIKSPSTALFVLAQECTDIPEKHRIELRQIAQTISDLAAIVLHKYKPTAGVDQLNMSLKHEALLISTLVQEVISLKRLEYSAREIVFEEVFPKESHFVFVEGGQTEFNRMLSNLINNAIEACTHGAPRIRLSLELSDNQVILGIADNGEGMPDAVIQRIMNEQAVTAGKVDGHGIGLTQVRQTLKEYLGKMEIKSVLGQGTLINLIFKQLPTSAWIANRIEFAPGATVLILDDYPAIHTSWDQRLRDVTQEGGLAIQHFRIGREAMAYVDGLSAQERENLFLLADYELLKQDVNGLDVIEHTSIKHSILVTSHYTNPEVLERAAMLGTKILPKSLVLNVPISIKKEAEKQIEMADLIIVDDKPELIQVVIDYALKDKKVALYSDPYQFLQEYRAYPKEMPIFLDDDFGVVVLNGRYAFKKPHLLSLRA